MSTRTASSPPLRLTIAEYAKVCGVSARTLQDIERGESSPTLATADKLLESLEQQSSDNDLNNVEPLIEQSDNSLVRLINTMIVDACNQGASDIHIETYPTRRKVRIRFRKDGHLAPYMELPHTYRAALVARIKIMCDLDISERRKPQDGKIKFKRFGPLDIELRVATLPSAGGVEDVVMRILSAGEPIPLDQLGLTRHNRERLIPTIEKPYGLFYVCGPTGSGKTTTLYASLVSLNDRTRNILTVEDPIEYHLEGIGQTQVNSKVDMTFARGLRAILRQDPDVVMVGEIRDKETAEIAVQASLTGHLVLSTLHTNSAIGAITRLVDMGIEPFLLSSSLLGVLAQRLVRVLCPHCKEAYQADEAECKLLGVPFAQPPTLYHARGCAECHQQGYRGRTGIYELVVFDDHLRTLIHNAASEQDMTRHARSLGPSIREDGRRKVLEGATTVEEVLRVTREE